MDFRVQAVDAQLTWPLRQLVLRPHQQVVEMAFPDDDDPLTGSFAAFDANNEVIGVARVAIATPPFPVSDFTTASARAWQLRGMATRDNARGLGVGSAVLAKVVDHANQHGGGLLWCHARMVAIDFYRKQGFTEFGETWMEPNIGEHIVAWKLLG